MLFRSCCLAPPAPTRADSPPEKNKKDDIPYSSPQTTANTQKQIITEEDNEEHHSLRKMFSRDAMPLGVPASSTTPPLPGRLFSRDAVNTPSSPARLNRFFSRGAVEESTPRNSSRKLVTILDSTNDEDGVEDDVHQIIDANAILDAIAEHVETKQLVVLERTITFPPLTEESTASTCFDSIYELRASQDMLNMGSVEITSLQLASGNASSTVYSSFQPEEQWTKEHELVVEDNGLVRGPIDLNQPRMFYLSNAAPLQQQLPASPRDLIQVKCINSDNNVGSPFVQASLRLQTVLWSVNTHHLFPLRFKLAVRTLMLCNAHKLLLLDSTMFRLFAMLPFDWF